MPTPTERRRHRRKELACPITILDADGKQIFHTRTANISDGGAYLAAPAAGLPGGPLPERVCVRLAAPRETACTYMLEPFDVEARILRGNVPADAECVGMAMEFARPIALDLHA